MYSLSIRKQYNAKVLTSRLWDLGPSANSAIDLDGLPFGVFDHVLDPLILDNCSVWALPYCFKIAGRFHTPGLIRLGWSAIAARKAARSLIPPTMPPMV